MPFTRVRLNAFGGPEELEIETVPDPKTWRRIGLARLPIVLVLAALTWFS